MKIILFLLISVNLYSQDNDYLKSQDTIYLLLDESKDLLVVKKKTFTYNTSGNGSTNFYEFTNNEGKKIFFQTFNDKQGYGNLNRKIKTKDFIYKNKGKMIDLDFIDKYGLTNTFMSILQKPKKKVIYIINSTDLKKRKAIMKRTTVIDTYLIEI